MQVIKATLRDLETKTLCIGFQGENIRAQMELDCSEIFAEYPNATPSLIVKPFFGEAYPVVVDRVGTDVVWLITAAVLSFRGEGEIQLHFYKGEVIAKSYVGKIKVRRSLEVTGDMPDPVTQWVDAATAKLNEVDAQIDELEDMVEAAEAARDEAQDIADDLQSAVLIQPEQPTEDVNVLWIDSDTVTETEVPTMEEFNGLKSAIEEIGQHGIDASGAFNGQVPVANGEGSWQWDDPSGGAVQDVQVNGVSVLQNGVANVPIAELGTGLGLVKLVSGNGIGFSGAGNLMIAAAIDAAIKNGTNSYTPVVPSNQHTATFYGLAKAAGADEKNSTLPVGQYTESAKSAIHEMLNGSVSVSGTTPTINALPGVRYICGEVSTITITVPASGIVDVVFTSGSTPAVLTINGTVRWANGFDPDNLDADTVYELNIADGLGVAASWT